MKICEAGRSSGCCRNPDIRTINTMDADTAGNFEIRAGIGVGITTETNGIRIAYTGGITTYTNTDGNLDIDNANFTIDLANDIVIAGNLTVNGTYYTVHAEHVYTEDDYIIMRDGAVTGLGSGDYSGFQVKLYDGVNDGRLVIDKDGVARVGDVGDEQPLLTRDESADLTDGNLLEWDGTNQKAIDAGINVSNIQPKITVITKGHNNVPIPTGYFRDTDLAVTLDPGTYFIIVGMHYTLDAIGDLVAVCGFYDGSDNWLQNNYPTGETNDTNRINGSFVMNYNTTVTVSPLFYRKTTGNATTGSTVIRIVKIA